MTWLADVDRETFWAHFPWTGFGPAAIGDHDLALLPVFGMGAHGLGLPMDAEEVLGSLVLRLAVARIRSVVKVRVLPPVRFTLTPYPTGIFGLDPETAHDQILEICEGVKAAGFQKLAFLTTSPWGIEFLDATSRDVRVGLALQTYVIKLGALGLDFHPNGDDRARVQAAVAKILGQTPRLTEESGFVTDTDFRPGNYQRPAPLTPGPPMDGMAFARQAAERLAGVLMEIVARPPLSGGSPRNGLTLPPEPESEGEPPPVFPQGFRTRYLPALTHDEWAALPDKASAWVIIPTASIEQHGPHLPVGVDAMLGHAWAAQTLQRFPAGARVYVAPPITYGKSNEHFGFPGTLSVSGKTFRRILIAIATQLKNAGFRQIAVLNSHGGNTAVLTYTLREIQTTLGLRAGMLGQPYKPELSPQEAELGFHAGEWETSLMLAIASDLVRMDKAVSEYPARREALGELRVDGGAAYQSWMTSDISESGVMGDAKAATLEKGQLWLEAGSAALAKKIDQLSGR